MERLTVVGVFGSPMQAEQVREELIAAGADEASVVLSADLTEDDVAAEAPGQSYENQPGQRAFPPRDSTWFGSLTGVDQAMQRREAQENEAVRSGSCAVSADVRSTEEARRAHGIMQRHGARTVYQRHLMDAQAAHHRS